MSISSNSHVGLPLGNSGSNRWIPVSQTQHLQSDCTETFYPGQEFIRILLGSWYPSLVPQLLCTRAGGKRLPGIVLLYSWEQDSTLWPDTCNDFYLTFKALVKLYRMIYCSLWSARLSNVLSRQNSFCLSTNNLVLWNSVLLHWVMLMLIFDVMQCRIIDSIAQGLYYLWQNLWNM